MQDKASRIFKAIADPTRREIFHALVVASVAMPINSISEQFDMSRQGVTKHIKMLEDAGLVAIHTEGRERFCFADPTPLKMVQDWIGEYEEFWDGAIGRLNNYLEDKNQKS